MNTDYEFNDCGVCINPKETFRLKSRNGLLIIRVAECDRGFISGNSWVVATTGGSSPVSNYKGVRTFSSEQEATKWELDRMVEYFAEGWSEGAKEFAEDIRKEREKRSVTQLSLFERW